MDDAFSKVKSLQKAIKLLDCFTGAKPERGINEVSEAMGINKSTVYKIFDTFVDMGILQRDEETAKYRLGIKVVQLYRSYQASNDTIKIIHPFMVRICQQVHESVYLAVCDKDSMTYVDNVFPEDRTPGRSTIGVVVPMHCTAVGKCVLAFGDQEKAQSLIKDKHEKFTPNTLVTWPKLSENLELIRSRGYSTDDMEHEYGIKCVGVPVRNHSGNIIAAISVSGPSLRFNEQMIERTSQILLQTAREISQILQ